MRALARICFFALFGCLGSSAPAADAGGDAACNVDSDCDDGVYCNGAERCVDDDGARTCISGSLPCADECVESEQRCEACRDSDGDGSADAACGGTDCDDSDPTVYPGATEVCDPEGIDEDCDPSTLGRDADGDGFVDAACCNGDVCGTDCNDAVRNANPDAPEVCNGTIDDDCDGSVDEGVTETFYRDVDGDSYGDPTITMQGCSAPDGWTVLCCDCDDRDPRFNPAATELCMPAGADEDCDDATDEGCDCTFTGARPCGPGAPFAGVGACRDGTQTCSSAGTLSECVGAVSPAAETCNGLDDDCNGTADNGFICPSNGSTAGTTICGRPGLRRCQSDCTWLDSDFFASGETADSCDYCADTLAGIGAEIAIARSDTSTDQRAGLTHRLFGNAACSYSMGACQSASLHTTGGFGDPDQMGAIYGPNPIEVGYGRVVVRASITAYGVSAGGAPPSFYDPRQGWAVTILNADPRGPAFNNSALDLTIPFNRDGWAVEWRYYSTGSETDRVQLRELHASSTDPVLESTGLSGFGAEHRSSGLQMSLEITIQPDDPTTPSNETLINIRASAGGVPAMYEFGCGSISGVPCGRRVRPGDAFDIGVASASGGTGGGNRTAATVSEFRITRNDHCP